MMMPLEFDGSSGPWSFFLMNVWSQFRATAVSSTRAPPSHSESSPKTPLQNFVAYATKFCTGVGGGGG